MAIGFCPAYSTWSGRSNTALRVPFLAASHIGYQLAGMAAQSVAADSNAIRCKGRMEAPMLYLALCPGSNDTLFPGVYTMDSPEILCNNDTVGTGFGYKARVLHHTIWP